MPHSLRSRWSVSAARFYLTATAGLSLGYVAQLCLQMTYFILLTRMLGAEVFGEFATTSAAIMLLSPFVGLGYSEVALVRVSQNRSLDGLWFINATYITAVMGFLVACLLTSVAFVLDSEKMLWWPLVFGLAFGELVCVRCCNVVARIYQARQALGKVASINVGVSLTKVSAVSLLYLTATPSLGLFIIGLNLALSALVCFNYFRLRSNTTPAGWSLVLVRENVSLASSFAGSVFCKTAYTDLDKIILSRCSEPAVVGMYAAAYKLLSLSFTPIRAFLEVTFSRQIALAAKDQRECAIFSVRILFFCVTAGAIISAVLYGVAPFLISILGPDYTDSVSVVRLGAMLPIVQAIHYTFGNHQTATGKQRLRTILQTVVLAVYVPVGLYMIPMYSWRGAIYTSIICEGLLAILGVVVFLYYFPSRRDELADRSGDKNE